MRELAKGLGKCFSGKKDNSVVDGKRCMMYKACEPKSV